MCFQVIRASSPGLLYITLVGAMMLYGEVSDIVFNLLYHIVMYRCPYEAIIIDREAR